MTRFGNFISLGYFCSVAEELERLGLRSASSPFDWCISDFEGVISAINSRFDGFLEYELLSQSVSFRNHYYNNRYGIWFFHDFDQYRPLRKQLGAVSAKYVRRIDRFYRDIKNPTLFIRYISDELVNNDGKSVELEYIEQNIGFITSSLKAFNPDNEIIFLANSEVESDVIDIYHVDKDENDTVARMPLHKNAALYDLLSSIEFEQRAGNLAFHQEKQRKKSFLANKLRALRNKLRARFCRVYIHDRQISAEDK